MSQRNSLESHIRVEKISLRGPGVVMLTGPSSCGKGEIAAALSRIMSIPPEAHLSMGEILRKTIQNAKESPTFRSLLSERYQIDKETNIFSCIDTTADLTKKVQSHLPGLESYFGLQNMADKVTQLQWLEYCTMNGLLVPNRWTQEFIAAHIEHTPHFRSQPFILDGYPRRLEAAQHLLQILRRLEIPIIKVLHLSISKQEMICRASARGRADDDQSSLLSRYQFYVESVQPTVDYLKMELGAGTIALIDAHQPVYHNKNGEKKFSLEESIANVVVSVLRNLGVPRAVVRDLIQKNS